MIVDPTNPIGFDENGQMIRTLVEGQSSGSIVAGLLPAAAHYVKAFGSLAATQLADSAKREPRVVLFYATDDDTAAATAERLIRAAGFEPVSREASPRWDGSRSRRRPPRSGARPGPEHVPHSRRRSRA